MERAEGKAYPIGENPMFSKIARPALLTLGLVVLGAGAASANDYYYASNPCNPCQPVKVVRTCDPCSGGYTYSYASYAPERRGFRWFGWFRR